MFQDLISRNRENYLANSQVLTEIRSLQNQKIFIMWEMMLSWWWIRPIPPTISQLISRKENNFICSGNRESSSFPSSNAWKWRKSYKKSSKKTNPSMDQVKFLYESKSGKSTRRNSLVFSKHPDRKSDHKSLIENQEESSYGIQMRYKIL